MRCACPRRIPATWARLPVGLGAWGDRHSPSEDRQAQDLKECALGGGHRPVGDAAGTSPLSRPGTATPRLGASGLTQALPPHHPVAKTHTGNRATPIPVPAQEDENASTRKHAGGGSRQPHKGQAAETAWSPRRNEWTDSGGPAAQRSMTCPPKGNSHEGYSTDETHVKQVRHERPQVVGLLLDECPEQANPRGSEQPGGYQGWGGGETTSGIRGDILETRGVATALNWTRVSCECHRKNKTYHKNQKTPTGSINKPDLSASPGKPRGACGPSSSGSGSLGPEPRVPAPPRLSCMGKMGDVSRASLPLALLSWGCPQGEAGVPPTVLDSRMIWSTLVWTDQTPQRPLERPHPNHGQQPTAGCGGRGSGWARHRAWFGQRAAHGQKGPCPMPRLTSQSEGPTLSAQGGFH